MIGEDFGSKLQQTLSNYTHTMVSSMLPGQPPITLHTLTVKSIAASHSHTVCYCNIHQYDLNRSLASHYDCQR